MITPTVQVFMPSPFWFSLVHLPQQPIVCVTLFRTKLWSMPGLCRTSAGCAYIAFYLFLYVCELWLTLCRLWLWCVVGLGWCCIIIYIIMFIWIVVIRNSVFNGKTQLIEGDKQSWPISFFWKAHIVSLIRRHITFYWSNVTYIMVEVFVR